MILGMLILIALVALKNNFFKQAYKVKSTFQKLISISTQFINFLLKLSSLKNDFDVSP